MVGWGLRDHARGVAATRRLGDEGLSIHPLTLDVTQDASVRAAAEHVGRVSGCLDILVNPDILVNNARTLQRTCGAGLSGLVALDSLVHVQYDPYSTVKKRVIGTRNHGSEPMRANLMNTWYMAAWRDEVSKVPLARRMLDMGMVLYRKQDGGVVMLRDQCPHRFAPLSKGTVKGDFIQCPYHGLTFDAAGQCVAAPLEEKPPRAVRVRSLPVLEQDGIVWFWPGDPEAVDPSLVPDFSYLTDPAFKHVSGLTFVDAHFELETDNLMDLSHVEMLHPSFGGVLSASSQFKAYREGDTVHSRWFSARTKNAEAMEHGPFPTGGEPIDQWLEMRWNAPGAMYLEVAVTRTGAPRQDGYTMPSVHILTPQTEHSTLYFWAASLRAEDQVPMDLFRKDFLRAFEEEDKPMIEAVAQEMAGETDLLAMKPLLLRSDAGSVLARRVLAEMIKKEQQSRPVAESAKTLEPVE